MLILDRLLNSLVGGETTVKEGNQKPIVGLRLRHSERSAILSINQIPKGAIR